MSNRQVSVLLVGINGFGRTYLNALLHADGRSGYTLAGVVDVQPERSTHYEELKDRGIPIHTSMERFFAEARADLTIIATPIQFHCEQTEFALANGSHVLCEKPVAATVQEALRMQEAEQRAGKFVAIGFNWSFDSQMGLLKRDIMSGMFGKPLRLKSIVQWSRNEQYYGRSRWAGRQKSDDGKWVLDSVAHNATAHYLHNLFYLLGGKMDGSARLRSVEAELYRANDIENFDTCAARIRTEDDVEVLFYASHAIARNVGPRFCLEFEKAVVTYGYEQDSLAIKAAFRDGTEKRYGDVGKGENKVWDCIELARADSLDVPCGIEAALAEVICVNGMQQSVPDIASFPAPMVRRDEETGTVWVDGLHEALLDSYGQNLLPFETGAGWARKGRLVDLQDYREYRG